MSNADLMLSGLKLMVLGMGIVYIFLIVMIYLMKLLQKVLAPWATLLDPAPKKPAAKPAAANSADADLAAAAVVAVKLASGK